MAQDPNDKKIVVQDEEEGSQTGESGQGGVAGEIRFRYKDAMSVGPRDDALPPSEVKRLLAVHYDLNKSYIDKQRQTRKERKQLKEGRASLTSRQEVTARAGRGERYSPYKKHPISNRAQFSGVDRQISALPTENLAVTNEQNKNELQNKLQNKHRLTYQNAPRFNPKPRPY